MIRSLCVFAAVAAIAIAGPVLVAQDPPGVTTPEGKAPGDAPVAVGATVHVHPSGDDTNPGTEKRPLKTPVAARNAVRRIKAKGMPDGGITVYLHGGSYRVKAPLVLSPEDSGKPGKPVVWKAFNNEKPVLSGGVPVTAWTEHKDGIWKAKLERKEKLRQLYVNDIPARMAAYDKALIPLGWRGRFTVKGDEPWAGNGAQCHAGFGFKTSDVPAVKAPEDLELQQRRTWTIQRVNVKGIASAGEETVIEFEQPVGAIGQRLGWGCGLNPAQWKECYLYNAAEFLDAPGEFYFDRSTATLYYKPRPGENMATAAAVVPVTDKLLRVQGTDRSKRVHDLSFEGLTFAHTGWQMMKVGNSHGALTIQSSAMSVVFKADGNWHRRPYPFYTSTDLPASAVEVNSAENVRFRDNVFRDLGCMALNIENDVRNVDVTGNVFQWVEGGGVNVGHPQHTFIGKENDENLGYGPYNIDNSKDKWDENVEGLVSNVNVRNNLFRDTCWTWWQMSPLAVYYGHSIHLAHNDLQDTPYNAITIGWSWSEFNGIAQPRKYAREGREGGKPSLSVRDIRLIGNRVVRAFRKLNDAGALYFIGDLAIAAKDPKQQKDFSLVRENYVESDPRRAATLLYTDEGTAFLRVEKNVFVGPLGGTHARRGRQSRHKILQGNFVTDAIGTRQGGGTDPFVVRKDNTLIRGNRDKWPAEAQAVFARSGLEAEFKELFDKLVHPPLVKGNVETESGRH